MADDVAFADLRLGPLVAEGGQGRVYALADRPNLVLKAYRSPVDRVELTRLVGWTDGLAPADQRVLGSTAWPTAVVIEERGSQRSEAAAGLLMPRAPRRFSVRHRDGSSHLATLSYLSADPALRAAAYGLAMPAPLGVERVGLVYALSRLLEVLEEATPAVSHGDLSSKNVLWSLQRGPEVFVLDCDNSALAAVGPGGATARDGQSPARGARRRAMTPNWDDPAVPAGMEPTMWSDRYSLALIFLRVCAAAHYPIQARQKRGERLTIDVAVPVDSRRAPGLQPDAPLWSLCRRGLSVSCPDDRPSAREWAGVLESLLVDLQGRSTLDAVDAVLGIRPMPRCDRAEPAPRNGAVRDVADFDVMVRPVAADERVAATSTNRAGAVAIGAIGAVDAEPFRMGSWSSGPGVFGPSGIGVSPSGRTPWRVYLGRAGRWWLAQHRRTLQSLRAHGHRRTGLRGLAVCVGLDVALAIWTVFIGAMLVSPFLGI